MVGFARTRDGDLWVEADLPLEAAVSHLDQVLGLVVEASRSARAVAYAKDSSTARSAWIRVVSKTGTGESD